MTLLQWSEIPMEKLFNHRQTCFCHFYHNISCALKIRHTFIHTSNLRLALYLPHTVAIQIALADGQQQTPFLIKQYRLVQSILLPGCFNKQHISRKELPWKSDISRCFLLCFRIYHAFSLSWNLIPNLYYTTFNFHETPGIHGCHLSP